MTKETSVMMMQLIRLITSQVKSGTSVTKKSKTMAGLPSSLILAPAISYLNGKVNTHANNVELMISLQTVVNAKETPDTVAMSQWVLAWSTNHFTII